MLAASRPATIKPAAGKSASASPMPAPRPAAAPSTGYALQLFGVSTRAAATGFIGRHGLDSSARIIDTRRNGKPWFIVTYGQYASRTTAQNAAARLPPAVQREVEPWVRDVKSLNALPR
jgi:DamX protein